MPVNLGQFSTCMKCDRTRPSSLSLTCTCTYKCNGSTLQSVRHTPLRMRSPKSMKAVISARLLASSAVQPKQKPFEIVDRDLRGFLLRVQPSGAKSYVVQIARGRRVTIGAVGHMTPMQARERAEKVLGNVAHSLPPLAGLDPDSQATLGTFIEHTYKEWVHANRPKTAAASLHRLERCFDPWYSRPLQQITAELVEDWKTGRLKDGRAATTVIRDIASLSAVLTRAVKVRKLESNPVRNVDKPRVDRRPKVRYLSEEEEARLRVALSERDDESKAERLTANEWRRQRAREPLPALPHYADHLTPAVLLSMNTGLRRGELLSLRWADINFREKLLTVDGGGAKSGDTRHVPLNSEALQVIEKWKVQAVQALQLDRVFPVRTSFKTAWRSLMKRASISRFRWHDLRHHFASRLAQAGVPLNTIRELLGHGSLAMTLRYAHLAPNQGRDAVAKLHAPRFTTSATAA